MGMKQLIFGFALLASACVSVMASPKEDAENIVDQAFAEMLSEELVPPKPVIKALFSSMPSFKDLSENDIDAVAGLFLEKFTPKFVPELRNRFVSKLVETLSQQELEDFRGCLSAGNCQTSSKIDSIRLKLKDIQSFGLIEGQKVGQRVGLEIMPDLVEAIMLNEQHRFEDPKSVARAVQQ